MIGKSELMVSLVKPDSHKTLICPQEIQLLPPVSDRPSFGIRN